MWQMIAILVVSLAISYLTRPQMKASKPAALEDAQLPAAEEGSPQCVFFGDCWTSDWQVLAYGRFRSRPIKTKSGK